MAQLIETTTVHYFTFGADHSHNGVPLQNRYVAVSAPEGIDHRDMFMSWFGSNAFAFEYDMTEFPTYLLRYEPRRYAYITVNVEVTP